MEERKAFINERHQKHQKSLRPPEVPIKPVFSKSILNESLVPHYVQRSPMSEIVLAISSRELFDIIANQSILSVLILDIRRKEEYVSGHILRYSIDGLHVGGVLNIEPDYFDNIQRK